MSDPDFESAVTFILENEGGFVDKKEDLGGATNFGITQNMLSQFRNKKCNSSDIFNLTIIEAKDIYQQAFWVQMHLGSLPLSIATAIFDTAVNQGQMSATKLAQRALGSHVIDDGILGPETLKAIDVCDPDEFILNYIEQIQNKYVDICINASNQLTFMRGWLARSRRLYHLLDPHK
jgi:lysozyme family protein